MIEYMIKMYGGPIGNYAWVPVPVEIVAKHLAIRKSHTNETYVIDHVPTGFKVYDDASNKGECRAFAKSLTTAPLDLSVSDPEHEQWALSELREFYVKARRAAINGRSIRWNVNCKPEGE